MDESLIGTKVGRVRVLRLLGQGGMGEVFVGHDEVLDRSVALKSIRAERRLDAGSRARFLREARVLSQLAHPNICQIYDYIEGEEGDFLVLELISGRSLAQALEEGLDDRTRMRIGIEIAGVLAAAHEKGIVHRDLKPDNVMLADGDRVKVLDFGLSRDLNEVVARRLGPEGGGAAAVPAAGAAGNDEQTIRMPGSAAGERTDGSDALTQYGAVVGTLRYMSPEQARGEVATGASDVFSLGLLLQELFTGRQRFEPGMPFDEKLRAAREGTVPRVEGLPPALSALVTRCLASAPDARPSARDVEERLAFIRDEPLRRRRKFLVAASLLTLALFGIAMTIQSIHATRAERLAEQERQLASRQAEAARRVSDFLVGIFKVSDPGESRGNAVTARELLDKGEAEIRTTLRDQPEIRSNLMTTMGRVFESLGLYGRAEPLLEESLAAREKLFGPDSPEVAESLGRLARVLAARGEYERASTLLRRAWRILVARPGPETEALATTLNDLGNLEYDRGHLEAAERFYRRALALREKLLGSENDSVAGSLNNLANVCSDLGRNAEAIELYRRAIAIAEKLHGPDAPLVVTCEDNLGASMLAEGRLDEALTLQTKALASRERTLGADHPDVAMTLNNLAVTWKKRKMYDRAEPLYRRSIAIYEKALGPDHRYVAQSLDNLGNLLFAAGRYDEAEPVYRRAEAIYGRSLGWEHPECFSHLNNFADLELARGNVAAAKGYLLRAVEIHRKLWGDTGEKLAAEYLALASAAARLGRRDEALDWLGKWIDAGGGEAAALAKPELAPLRGNPRFEEIRILADARSAADSPTGASAK